MRTPVTSLTPHIHGNEQGSLLFPVIWLTQHFRQNHTQTLELLRYRLNQQQLAIRSLLIYLFKPKNKWKLSYSAWIPMQHFDHCIKGWVPFALPNFYWNFILLIHLLKHFRSQPQTLLLPLSAKRENKIVCWSSTRTFKIRSSNRIFSARHCVMQDKTKDVLQKGRVFSSVFSSNPFCFACCLLIAISFEPVSWNHPTVLQTLKNSNKVQELTKTADTYRNTLAKLGQSSPV